MNETPTRPAPKLECSCHLALSGLFGTPTYIEWDPKCPVHAPKHEGNRRDIEVRG